MPSDQLPYKFQPGNVTHELAAGLPGILEYFDRLAQHHGVQAGGRRERLTAVFELITQHEASLAERLLGFLRERPGVRIVGSSVSDPRRRVPTIAFTVDGRHASTIPRALDEQRVAVRFGHFYAKRAIDALGLSEQGGVVRVSMVHYNTLGEVDRLVAALDSCL